MPQQNDGGPQVILHPREVYYISPLGVGRAVSVVSFTRSTPYFVSYYETGDGKHPLSQDIETIKFMVEDAQKRIGVSNPQSTVPQG